MPRESRTFRIFVSSTFADFKAEREALQRDVFPELQKLCESNQCRFQAIDLRWGVSEEAALDQQTMNICLTELKRCRDVNPRPNFIILLGDRYGWIPLPPQIEASEFDAIADQVTDEEKQSLLEWYRLDTNAVPPEYVLRPRREEVASEADYDSWSDTEQRLREILLVGIEHLRWPEDDPRRIKYECSATHQEIIEGALKLPDEREHVFAFFRNIENRDELPPGSDYTDDGRDKVDALKQTIRETKGVTVFEHSARWNGTGLDSDTDAFATDVLQCLHQMIEGEIKKDLASASEEVAEGSGSLSPSSDSLSQKESPQPSAASGEAVHPSVGKPTHPLYLDENVQFTVHRPKIVEPNKWYSLLAFAHLAERRPDAPADEPDPIEEIQRQVENLLGDQISGYQGLMQDSTQSIPQEGEITFAPSMQWVEFNPACQTFLWQESVHRVDFRMRASAELDGHVARGRMAVFLGSILVAEIPLSIRVDHRQALQSAYQPRVEASAPIYRRIFASYSHADSAIVEEFERYARAVGDEYLRDVLHLRAGEVWNERLEQMINAADVFQLFWSWRSIRSPFVEKEWRYAVSLDRHHFVRPVYWEEPLPESSERCLPPEELRKLHFQRIHPIRETGTGSIVEGNIPGLRRLPDFGRDEAMLNLPPDPAMLNLPPDPAMLTLPSEQRDQALLSSSSETASSPIGTSYGNMGSRGVSPPSWTSRGTESNGLSLPGLVSGLALIAAGIVAVVAGHDYGYCAIVPGVALLIWVLVQWLD